MSSTQTTTTTATPASYLRYDFQLPSQRYVGLLACQRDPLLTSLETTVASCIKRIREAPTSAVEGGKSKGKKKAEVPVVVVEADEWEIQLVDTVLFPEGGGQPSDSGHLFDLDSTGSEQANIREVLRRGLDAVHYSDKSIEVGSKVRVEIDVEGRKDKMCQHTGQHLLSGILDRLSPPATTLSWSLTPFPTPCYVELSRALTPLEIISTQEEANNYIARSTPVQVEMNLVGSEGGMPGSVPGNYKGEEGDGRKGVLRTVEIVGLGDKNPCCGTHFPSLSHLQSLFILPHQTSIRGTNSRLSFLVGPRVLSHLATTHQLAREASLELQCSSTDLVERVATMLSVNKEAGRREKKLKEELSTFIAEALWRESEPQGESSVRGALSFRQEDSTNSLEVLTSISTSLKALSASSTPPAQQYLFILASGPTTPLASSTTPSTGAIVIIGEPASLVESFAKEIVTKLGARIKGGGKGKWQGKLTGNWESGDRNVLEEALTNARM